MRLLRAAVALILLAGVALGLSWLQGGNAEQPLPAGSSLSYQSDGAQGMYLWLQALGGSALRLETRPLAPQGAETLFILQPEVPFGGPERAALETVAQRGGTLVVAGDSVPVRTLLPTLGISLEPRAGAPVADVDGTALPLVARNRLVSRRADAQPLLLTGDGDVVALRQPYQRGWVVALATLQPLSNGALAQPAVARWAYRAIVAPALTRGAAIAFDETHYTLLPAQVARQRGFRDVALESPVGRALLLGASLTFVYLLLAGRRLGPALPPASPQRATRTMAEHVAALAGLYRRARQLPYLRQHYARHYRRAVARGLGLALDPDAPLTPHELVVRGVPSEQAAGLAQALGAVSAARSEADLVAAVARAEQALRALPRAARGTLNVAA